jgi:hypothetical protein
MTDDVYSAYKPFRDNGFASVAVLERGDRYGPLRSRPYYGGTFRGISFWTITKHVEHELYVTKRSPLLIAVGKESMHRSIIGVFPAVGELARTMTTDSPALADVKAQIETLGREDRASLRPWMLAHYDEHGDPHRRITDADRERHGPRSV